VKYFRKDIIKVQVVESLEMFVTVLYYSSYLYFSKTFRLKPRYKSWCSNTSKQQRIQNFPLGEGNMRFVLF